MSIYHDVISVVNACFKRRKVDPVQTQAPAATKGENEMVTFLFSTYVGAYRR